MSKRNIDYDYIAANISRLSYIFVRVYKDRELLCSYDPSNFPVDPASLYLGDFFLIDQPVSYFITPYDQFYGIIHHEAYCLIIGPTFDLLPSREKIREFMFELGLREQSFARYQELFSFITPLPLELFLHELFLIYYFISEKKLSLEDVSVYDTNSAINVQNKFSEDSSISAPQHTWEDITGENTIHTTVDFEKQMLSLISAGDVDGLQSLVTSQAPGRAGKMASGFLRQLKNIFISTATLCSRAAISGGLPAQEALSESDRFIQRCESLNDPAQIINLQSNMVMNYASLVAEVRLGARNSRFLRSVTGYVREHLTENFTVEQMADDLFLSRSHLSTQFKKETGMTLSAYITQQKIKKAQEYLKNTDKSVLEISTFLGFSSQGYFQNVFKKETGMTPKEWREQ